MKIYEVKTTQGLFRFLNENLELAKCHAEDLKDLLNAEVSKPVCLGKYLGYEQLGFIGRK